ncbi:hypothetical protein [Afifella pfennigii]|uniref:hypothetical protein n=1 Tax=Afifella pfennigii TaxID=209897 RepID=UPI00054D278C|nr:hypothetical protein [Afifella pfennigii]
MDLYARRFTVLPPSPRRALSVVAVSAVAAFWLASCASLTDPFNPMETTPEPEEQAAAPERSAARQGAIEEIRAKSAAQTESEGTFPHVFGSGTPENLLAKSPATAAAIEAELRSIAEARQQAQGEELAELQAREVELRRLVAEQRQQVSESIRQNSSGVR